MEEYHPHYARGHLLVAGGVLDQPARYLAFMAEIESMKKRVDDRFAAETDPQSEESE